MHVEVSGNGPDLVMIHGWAMHGGIFAPLVERLSKRFRVHCVDLPGHGRSRDEPVALLQPSACAAAIAELTPPAVWIGWSLGGLIAQQGALDHPDHVRGLVSIAATPCFIAHGDWPGVDAAVNEQFAANLANQFHATIDRFLALETLGSPDPQAELRELKRIAFAHGEPLPDALAEGLRILRKTDLRERLGELACSSLWISGRRDRLIPPAAMTWSAQRCDGELLTLNAGHAPFLSDTDAVASAITTFAEPIN
ncbi:MAG: pimeloyl-ACP methyl ester esterase BioH [Dokdonella sp.]